MESKFTWSFKHCQCMQGVQMNIASIRNCSAVWYQSSVVPIPSNLTLWQFGFDYLASNQPTGGGLPDDMLARRWAGWFHISQSFRYQMVNVSRWLCWALLLSVRLKGQYRDDWALSVVGMQPVWMLPHFGTILDWFDWSGRCWSGRWLTSQTLSVHSFIVSEIIGWLHVKCSWQS